jgi:phenylalanyl-tRNA synthetase beta chain
MPAARALGLEGPVLTLKLTPDRADCYGVAGIARDLAAAGLGRLVQPRLPPGAECGPTGPGDPARLPRRSRRRPARSSSGASSAACATVPRPPGCAAASRPIGASGPSRPWSTSPTTSPSTSAGRFHVFDADKLRRRTRGPLRPAGRAALGPRRAGVRARPLDDRDRRRERPGEPRRHHGRAKADRGHRGDPRRPPRGRALRSACAPPPTAAGSASRATPAPASSAASTPSSCCPRPSTPPGSSSSSAAASPGPRSWRGPSRPAARPSSSAPPSSQRLAGITLPPDEIRAILEALGFGVEGGPETWRLEIPSWRQDVTSEACIVEELTRLHGYDRIPPVPVERGEAVARALAHDRAAPPGRGPPGGRRTGSGRGRHLVLRAAAARRPSSAARPCGWRTR